MGGGGAERQLAVLAESLPATGWEPHVAVIRGGPNLSRLLRANVVVHDLGLDSPYDPRVITRIMAIVRRVRPAIIQTWLPMMDIVGGTVAAMTGVPWILSERVSRSQPPFLKGAVRKALAHRAAAIIGNSMTSLDRCRTRWPDVPRYFVPNAVPLDEIDAAPLADARRLPGDASAPVVVAAARLHPTKNHAAFLEGMVLATATANIRAVIYGDGPIRDKLAQMIISRGLTGRVFLEGYVDDLWSRMKTADVFVSLSEFEGRPNSVLEAMACRTPLVVSDIPEHREFLTPDCALLVKHHDARGVAAAIVDSLADGAAARQRAALARDSIETASPRAIAEEHARVYEAVMSRH